MDATGCTPESRREPRLTGVASTRGTSVDFIVIGAGMAGASAAFELSRSASVAVLEREAQPGYHSTGRSAALFSEIYGNAVIRALSRASRPFLMAPPAGFADGPLLRPRGVLYVASDEQRAAFESFRAMPDIAAGTRAITAAEALERVPILRPERAVLAAYEPDAMDVEVHGLHQAYLRGLRARGGTVVCDCTLHAIERTNGLWRVTTSAGSFAAPVLIDAAGAWADEIAALAGVPPIGLVPMRRTVAIVEPPPGLRVEAWPMVIDVAESFYFKPDAGRLLLSPADETPSPACDAQPDDLDVAIAVDRIEQATVLDIRRVTHRWAGLRSFVADRSPVVGFDPAAPGFFWLAGQGGYGIQTAPALARAAANLARGEELPAELADQGVTSRAIAPARLRTAAT